MEYFYSKRDHAHKLRDVEPVAMSGDREICQEWINRASDKFENCYKAGVLSFEENDLPLEKKYEIMQSFERSIMPSLKAGEDYYIHWIEHRDKGRLELNFIIPRIHLENGKSLQPYYVGNGADFKRINAWKDIINIEYDLSDPNDPLRERTVSPVFGESRNVDEWRKEVEDYLVNVVQVENRSEVLAALNDIEGVEVAKATKTTIRVKVDGLHNDKTKDGTIRLVSAGSNNKVGVFNESYRRPENPEEDLQRRGEIYQGLREERYREARKKYFDGYRFTARENRKRYGRKIRQPYRELEQPHEAVHDEINEAFSERIRPATVDLFADNIDTDSVERGVTNGHSLSIEHGVKNDRTKRTNGTDYRRAEAVGRATETRKPSENGGIRATTGTKISRYADDAESDYRRARAYCNQSNQYDFEAESDHQRIREEEPKPIIQRIRNGIKKIGEQLQDIRGAIRNSLQNIATLWSEANADRELDRGRDRELEGHSILENDNDDTFNPTPSN